MKLKFLIAVAALFAGTMVLNTSCQKKTDCELTIRTLDSAGNVLPGATVKLYANVKTSSGTTVEADLKATGVSDGSGVSTYTFKLPAILDVTATKGNKVGQAIVKLEEGQKVDKSVTVK